MTRSTRIATGLAGLVVGVLAFICGINIVEDTYDGREVSGGDYCYDRNEPGAELQDVAEFKETNVVGRIRAGGIGGIIIFGSVVLLCSSSGKKRLRGHS